MKVPAHHLEHRYLHIAVILIVTFLIFFPSTKNYFHSDDFFILQEPILDGASVSLGDLAGEFVTPSWGLYYRPIFRIAFHMETKAFGLNPLGYHLMNLLVYALTCVAVYYLILLLVDRRDVAFLSAILFGTHSVHVQPVLWASGMNGLLADFFFLLAVVAFVVFRTRRATWSSLACSTFLFCLAVWTKESAIVLPLVLVLYDVVFHCASWDWSRRLRNAMSYIPFFAVGGVFLLVRFAVMSKVGPIGSLNVPSLQLTVQSLLYAARLVLAPFDWSLPPSYYVGASVVLPSVALTLARLVLAVSLVGFIFYLLLKGDRGDRRVIVFFLLWIPATILPFLWLGIFPANRYVYLASVGAVALIPYLAIRCADVLGGKLAWRRLAIVALVILAVLSGLSTLEHEGPWAAAGRVTQYVVKTTRSLFPSLPQGAVLLYVNLPDKIGDAFVFRHKSLNSAISLAYEDPTIAAANIILPDQLSPELAQSPRATIARINAKGGYVHLPRDFFEADRWEPYRRWLIDSGLLVRTDWLSSDDVGKREKHVLLFQDGRLIDVTSQLLQSIAGSLYVPVTAGPANTISVSGTGSSTVGRIP